MTTTTNAEGPPRASDDLRLIERRLDDLTRHVAELTRIISATVAPPRAVEGANDRRVDELESRLRSQERRAASIAGLVRGHDRMIRMMCLLLKEIDDPYGMGTSLDERLGLDDRDECEDPS